MEGRRQIWAVVNRVRSRFWIMTGLGAFSLSLLILTILLNDWIEIAFRIDPDGGSGSTRMDDRRRVVRGSDVVFPCCSYRMASGSYRSDLGFPVFLPQERRLWRRR